MSEKDPKCSDCKEYPCTPGYCDDYEFFEPKEKLSEAKLYFCENCGNEISEVEHIVQNIPEAKPEKQLECHGCGEKINDHKYWCVKCIKDTEKLWEKPYYELIEEFVKKIDRWLDSNYSIYWLDITKEYKGMLKK